MNKRRPTRHRKPQTSRCPLKQQLRRAQRDLARARADVGWYQLNVVQWQAFSLSCIQGGMETIAKVEREAQVMWLTIPNYGRWGVMND